MKALKRIVVVLVLFNVFAVTNANALIVTVCTAGDDWNANWWWNACSLRLINEPIITGATEIKSVSTVLGQPWVGTTYYGDLILSTEGFDDVVTTGLPPNEVMNAYALSPSVFATKYLNPPTNTIGITWKNLTAWGTYHGKINSQWSYFPEYDTVATKEVSTE